jgi:AbrB family looped-hinge helix DNA binding protein
MLNAKLTTKYQTTIPKNIRKKLKLDKGDYVTFEEIDGVVFIRKMTPYDFEHTKALEQTLSDWDNKNDDEAFNDL